MQTRLLAVFLSLFLPFLAYAAPQNKEPTYQQHLYQQIIVQQQRAAYYLTQLQMNPANGEKFREAEKMLEVKQILYENFATSPALSNMEIRKALYELMEKEKIEPGELIVLQTKVNNELNRR